MAQTDARAGFRLPWSSDRQSESSDSTDMTESETAEDPTATGAIDPAPEGSPPAGKARAVDPWTGRETEAQAPATTAAPVAPVTPAASPRKPSKFLADLTKAMQAAAEDARGRALTQLQADAKAQIEVIHGRSSTDAAGLRRKADDDVAAVREWSKAEIARIREETETKITARKARLETEIEQNAAVIEREIDAVQKTVAAFEDDMAAFFERLLAEEDPSRFATMAENLPEPPTFDGLVHAADADETEDDAVAEASSGEQDAVATTTGKAVASAEAGTSADEDVQDGGVDREAAFAAIQAAAEAAASAEVAVDAAARAEAVAGAATDGNDDAREGAEPDPRFAALGLSADFDAAEAEAFADAGSSDEEIPEISDDAIEARLAGLGAKDNAATEEATSTQVIVVGLVSVASIASFKRHLGRIAGVSGVGVSSGPEGEFIFTVKHGSEVALRDAVPSLPTFQARVTSTSDGIVNVTAHDPEADA